jgi:hypothetical protein
MALIEKNAFTDTVSITRDGIDGQDQAYGTLREMSFGKKGRVCKNVSRLGWANDNVERAMVFCVTEGTEEHCVIRPSVCNNWALVSKIDPMPCVPASYFENPDSQRRAALPASAASAVVHTVPEPATFWLVALACICVRLFSLKGKS